jgi:hypothetical protein
MPLYDFINEQTGEVEEKVMPYSELHKFQEDNPHMKYKPGFRGYADPTLLGTYTNRLPTQFREGILEKAKKAHPLGNIQT